MESTNQNEQSTVPSTPPSSSAGFSTKKLILLLVLGPLAVGLIVFSVLFLGKNSGDTFQGRYFEIDDKGKPLTEEASSKPMTAEAESKSESEAVSESGAKPVPYVVPGSGPSKSAPRIFKLKSKGESVSGAGNTSATENTANTENVNSITASSECSFDEYLSNSETPIKRAHFAKMLIDAANIIPNVSSVSTASDVSVSDPCFSYIQSILDKKVTGLYFDGTFHPNDTIDRSEAAVWTVKTFNIPFVLLNSGPSFPDVPANAWYFPYVEVLNVWKVLLIPRGESEFRPDNDATYGWVSAVTEAVKYLRSVNKVE